MDMYRLLSSLSQRLYIASCFYVSGCVVRVYCKVYLYYIEDNMEYAYRCVQEERDRPLSGLYVSSSRLHNDNILLYTNPLLRTNRRNVFYDRRGRMCFAALYPRTFDSSYIHIQVECNNVAHIVGCEFRVCGRESFRIVRA